MAPLRGLEGKAVFFVIITSSVPQSDTVSGGVHRPADAGILAEKIGIIPGSIVSIERCARWITMNTPTGMR
jgi:hypothetical protein